MRMNNRIQLFGFAILSLLLASVGAFSYTPHKELERFHNIKRVKFGSEVPGNTFNTNTDYLLGAIGGGAIIAAVGVLFFFIYLISMSICCCRANRKGRTRRVRPRGIWNKVTSSPAIVFLLAIFVLGIILGAIGRVHGFTDGLSSFVKAIDSVIESAGKANNALSATTTFTDGGVTYTSLTTTLNDISSVTSAQLAICQANPGNCPVDIRDALSDLDTIITDAKVVVGDAAGPVADITDNMGSITEKVNIEDINKRIKQAAYAVLGLMAFLLTFNYFFLCPSRCASITFKILIPFTLLLFALIWVLSGVFYATGLLGSDVCVAPVESINTVTEASSNDFLDTLNYYMQCEADPALPPAGAAQLIDDAKTMVLDGQTQFQTLLDAIDNNPGLDPTIASALQGLETNVDDLVLTVDYLADSVFSCTSIGNIINYLVDGLCNGGIRTTILLFEILIACSVIMTIQFFFANCVCLRHPGDKTAWIDREEKDDQSGVALQMATRNVNHGTRA